ncbi:MAG TPA: HD domain-containing phosphohydrolase [Bryobacteraceae bacterium]|nr:HD domain-containing phosphohydrolase [Bryobacteraceae bacterium]
MAFGVQSHVNTMPGAEQQLPGRVRVYIGFLALMSAIALGVAVSGWESPDLLKFAGFLVLATLSAGIHFDAPGISSGLSLNLLFVLFGIAELTPSETVVLAATVTLVQCFWNQKQPPGLQQIAFNISTITLAAAAATGIYHSHWMLENQENAVIRLALATVAFFLMNTVPVALAVGIAEGFSAWAVWRESYLWSLPYYLGGGAVAQAASIAAHFAGWPTVLLTGPVLYLVFRSYRLYISRLENERKHAEAVSGLHLRTIEALALAIEAKDDTTHDHLARVQVYAREIARELGLSREQQEALQAASILHDIGKLAVPEHIISKPGRLTPEEFDKMKIHPIVGAEILERVQFPYPVVPIVRAHHEKWDGSGYPHGLKGEEIPIGARILAAVDCLDALATDRQYRRALPLDEAMKVVQKEAGTSFDPRVVEVLTKHYVALEKMAKESRAADPMKLSKDVKVERGLAPAAGFEAAAPNAGAATPGAQAADFLSLIAAARQEVQALFEISQDLGNSLSLDETLSLLGVRLRRIVPHHGLAIWVQRAGILIPEFVAGDDFRLFSSLQIPVGQGLSGWVAENRKAILNGNPSVESGYLNDPSKFSALRSALAVPLEGTGGVVGVLTLYHSDRDAFTKDHLRILLAINAKIALSIENALRFRQAETSATTDYLTGLPNARSLFLQFDAELSRSRRSEQPIAVLTLDLNGFKQVNDRCGHLEGNRALRAVGIGLKSVCREYDQVARMGGDEFVLVLPGARAGEISAKFEQIRSVISQVSHEMFSGQMLSVSIGAAYFPEDGSNADELLSVADRRMYSEKQSQRQDAITPSRVLRERDHSASALVN